MPRLLAFSAALAVLVGATVGPKLVAQSRESVPDEARLAGEMAAMLGGHGFRSAVLPHRLFQLVPAEKGDCRLLAANMSAAGYKRTRFAQGAASYGPVRFYHGDASSDSFPRFVPAIQEVLQRWGSSIGIVAPRVPVIAVAASPECRLDGLPWEDLRIWPHA